MKKRRKLILLMVAVFMLTCVTGCKSTKDDKDTKSVSESKTGNTGTQNESTNGESSNSKVVFPLKEPVTLSCFVTTRPNIDDFDNNDMTKWIEEKTNIKLEFIVSAEGTEADNKLNLLLSTGEYPDVILSKNLSPQLQALYGGEGVLIPINDLIETQGEKLPEILQEYPMVKKCITMPDGNIYNMPNVFDVVHIKDTQKMWIYKPWLDKLGLELPTTTEEFRAVLKAFKEQDPNGNGIQDEIPMAGSPKAWAGGVEEFLMNAFVYNATRQGGARRLYVKDGKVVASYNQDAWKEGLKYIQSLVEEGLIARESFTQDSDALKRMGENPDTVILGCFPGGAQSNACSLSGDRIKGYVCVEPLKGPQGVQTAFYDGYTVYNAGLSITNKCKHPEVAYALGELLYSEEGTLWDTKGVEGVEWEFLDNTTDLLGLNGKKALYKTNTDQKGRTNYFWNQQGPNYQPEDFRLGEAVDPENPTNELVLYNETINKYKPHYPDISEVLPPLNFTAEQSGEILTYAATIDSFVDEKIASFCLGTSQDIDDQWDKYKQELVDMGVDKMIAIYQQALDVFNKTK